MLSPYFTTFCIAFTEPVRFVKLVVIIDALYFLILPLPAIHVITHDSDFQRTILGTLEQSN